MFLTMLRIPSMQDAAIITIETMSYFLHNVVTAAAHSDNLPHLGHTQRIDAHYL